MVADGLHLPAQLLEPARQLRRRQPVGVVALLHALRQHLLLEVPGVLPPEAQQLVGEHFGAGTWFPVIFGAMALVMACTNFANSIFEASMRTCNSPLAACKRLIRGLTIALYLT